jgi:hypothetical protein
MLRVDDGRTVRRWEAGEREIPGPVTVLMETAMGYLAKKELILQQLEMLRSGKMRTGRSEGNKMVDDTEDTIARLSEAEASYENALEILKSIDGELEILTRQPPVGEAANKVHWYHLRRQTPKYDPPQKDDWSIPGELSCEAALAYFEKHEGFSDGLEICDDDDLAAEFVLEKREVLRRQHGASQRLSPGKLIELFFVRRRPQHSEAMFMTEYRPEDINQQTVLYKDGDPSSQMVCPTLHEAVIDVKNRWSKDDQERARFKITGRGYEYSWADLKPHVD